MRVGGARGSLVMLVVAVAGWALIFGPTPASADFTTTLPNWNILDANGNPIGSTVTVNYNQGLETLSLTYNGSPTFPAFSFWKHVCYDLTSGASGVNSGSISGNSTSATCDGFGTFSVKTALFDGTSKANPLVLTFPSGTTATDNYVAAHLSLGGNCSGWVSNRTAGSLPSVDSSCAPVPEPGTALLMAMGLPGLAGVVGGVRRRGGWHS